MDGEWTYQLEVVLHGFTPEVIGGSIREVGDYQTVYTGFFGGGGEVGQPPPDDGVEIGEEHHRARQLRLHLLSIARMPSIVVPLASARAAEA